MAVTFVGEQHSNGGFVDALTVNVPSGVQDDDLMIALVWFDSDRTLNAPGAWTEVDSREGDDSTYSMATYYRVANAEPDKYTWHQQFKGTFGVVQFAFSGLASDAPHKHDLATYGSSPTNGVAPSVTTTKDCVIVTGQVSYSNSASAITHTSSDAGTEIVDVGNSSGVLGAYSEWGTAYFSDVQDPGTYAFHVKQSRSPDAYGMFTIALATGGMDATVDATAPSGVSASISVLQQVRATLSGTAGAASASAVGEIIPNVMRADAPAASAAAEADLTILGAALAVAPAAQASGGGFHDFKGTFRAVGPRAHAAINLENRVSGARIVTVRAENRTTFVVGQRHDAQ